MDPLGVGLNAPMLAVFNSYPTANVFTGVGDGLNTAGFRFVNTLHRSYNTYIARFDYNLSKNNILFVRGNLMGDTEPSSPQFPGQPASSSQLTNNKGFAVGYTAILRPTLVSNFRWGFTRQGGATSGASTDPSVGLQGLDSPQSFTRTTSFHIPVNNFIEDLSWTHGNHSFTFGTNLRVIHDARTSTANSFPDGSINTGWLGPSSAVANTGQPLDPAASGYAAVDPSVGYNYDSAIMDLVGVVTEGDAIYNYNKSGAALALGAPVQREYHWNEWDFYGQDTWRLREGPDGHGGTEVVLSAGADGNQRTASRSMRRERLDLPAVCADGFLQYERTARVDGRIGERGADGFVRIEWKVERAAGFLDAGQARFFAESELGVFAFV